MDNPVIAWARNGMSHRRDDGAVHDGLFDDGDVDGLDEVEDAEHPFGHRGVEQAFTQDDLHDFRTVVQHVEKAGEYRAQVQLEIAGVPEQVAGVIHGGDRSLEVAVDHRVQDVAFGVEVQVERPTAHSGALCDVGDAGLVVALLGELQRGRLRQRSLTFACTRRVGRTPRPSPATVGTGHAITLTTAGKYVGKYTKLSRHRSGAVTSWLIS